MGQKFGCVTLNFPANTESRGIQYSPRQHGIFHFCQLESESLQQTLTPDNLDHHGYERPSGSFIQVDIESESF
jgi:hypothetical protein